MSMFLGALGGADAIEIVVSLKNLSSAGFKSVEKDLVSLDAQAAATSKGGGLSSLISSTGSMLPAALGTAGLAVGAFAAIGMATLPVYEKVVKQENLLNDALTAHGRTLDAVRPQLDAMIATGERYGMNADDVRAAVTRLTQAGVDFATIQKELPAVMDLAIAKNMTAADAADLLAKATLGSARGLTDLGIKLPPVTGGLAGVAKAQTEVTKDSAALQSAQDHLAAVEASLAGKHKLTAAEATRLADAHQKVKDATAKLKTAQDALTAAQNLGASASQNFTNAAEAVKKSTGDTQNSVTDLQRSQVQLNNAWERFSTQIGPAVDKALATMIAWLADLVTWLGKAIDAMGKLWDQARQGQLGPFQGPFSNQGSNPGVNPLFARIGAPGHSAGGMVGVNGPELAWVGEGGPEYIINNPALTRMAAGGGGGGQTISITLNHTTTLDGRTLAREIDKFLHRSFVSGGTGIRRPLGG